MTMLRKAAAATAALCMLVSSTAYASQPVRAAGSLPTASASSNVLGSASLRKSAKTRGESGIQGYTIIAVLVAVIGGVAFYKLVIEKDSDG